MKILEFPNYVTIDNDKDLSRSRTGYGYMTIDIATSIAKLDVSVDLLTQSYITDEKRYKGIHILRRKWTDIFFNIKIWHIIQAFKIIIKDKIPLKRTPYILLYNLSMGYFEKIVKQNHYDLIHIHGIGYYTEPIIETCKKLNIKYLITLHGLISFSDGVQVSLKEKQKEKDLIRYAEKSKIPISVISTGIRKAILEYLKITDSETFIVIPNGCHVTHDYTPKQINIRSKYNIGKDKKIMLCVGNIGKRKNQTQIVNAFTRLTESTKQKIVILFIGDDTTEGEFKKAIIDYGLEKNLIICGNIPREMVSIYYSQADYNIVASISEGFGLSMIEGFVFGLPTVTYADLDAIPDIYSEKSMILVESRTDFELAKGIERIVSKKWEKNNIISHSMNFSLTKMSQDYIQLFTKVKDSKLKK